MKYTTPFKGNSLAVHYLQNQQKNATVATANLWIGPEHIGKTTLAHNYIFELYCQHKQNDQPCLQCSNCAMLQRDIHPNVIRVSPVEQSSITKATIDRVVTSLAQSSALPGWRVVVIEPADTLTVEAMHVLLKTLEEPPAEVVFLLLTTDETKILPTIQSRCAHLYFYAALPTGLTQGLPGLEVQFADEQQVASLKTLVQQWIKLLSEPLFSRRLDLLPTTITTAAELNYHLRIIESICHDVLLLHYQLSTMIRFNFVQEQLSAHLTQLSIIKTLNALAMINQIQSYLQRPVQPKLLVDQLLLTIYK